MRSSALLILTLLAGPRANAQEDFKISTDVDLVMMDVGVKDSSNRFVAGLSQEAFHLSDNGRSQPIRYFGAADLPATVGLVLDNSGSMRPKAAIINQSAAALIRSSNPQDEVFTVLFNDRVVFGLPEATRFSHSPTELLQALAQDPPDGRTALYDGLVAGLGRVREGSNGRRALVLISDGGDNASKTLLAELQKRVEQSTAAIYTIGIFDDEDPDRNPGVLRHIAEMSGGEYFRVADIMELPQVCQQIAQDIRNTYTLAFSPSSESRSMLHHLKVTATQSNGGRLSVRARTTYLSRGAAKDSAAGQRP